MLSWLCLYLSIVGKSAFFSLKLIEVSILLASFDILVSLGLNARLILLLVSDRVGTYNPSMLN